MPMVLEGVVMVMGWFLLILPPDQAQDTPADVDNQLARLRIGIVDEFIDGHSGVGPDGKGAAVEEYQVRAVVGRRRNQLIGLHVNADAQDALVLVGRLAKRIAVGARRD